MCDFDIQQLRYFVETAHTHSMAQAARHLFVSPQGLSKGIKKLEENLGRDLFVRGTAGVELTAFGTFFLQRSEEALNAFALVEDSRRDFEAHERRTISLGMPVECTSDFGGTLNASKLYELQRSFPTVAFEFRTEGEDAVSRHLESGEIQFAIGSDTGGDAYRSQLLDTRSFPTVAFEFRTEGEDAVSRHLESGEIQFAIGSDTGGDAYRSQLLDTFPLVVAVHRRSGLARRPWVTPRDLAGGRVMAPGGQRGLERMMRAAGYAGSVVDPVIKLSPIDISELVVDDRTFVVRPEQHARRTTTLDHVTLVPLVDGDGQPLEARLCLSWRNKMRIGGPERALIDFLTETYANR